MVDLRPLTISVDQTRIDIRSPVGAGQAYLQGAIVEVFPRLQRLFVEARDLSAYANAFWQPDLIDAGTPALTNFRPEALAKGRHPEAGIAGAGG